MSDSPKVPSFPRSLKQSPAFRRAVVALAAAAAVGCDDLGATGKSTIAKVDAAITEMSKLPSLKPGQGVATVTSGLTDAATNAASGIYKVNAAGTAAAVDQQAAFAAALELNNMQAGVRRTLTELRRLADQVGSSNAFAAGYLKADPKEAVADLSSHISAMQGNAQALKWGPGDAGTLPTLAAAKQDATKLQGELEQKQAELDGLKKQRAELLATAEVQLNHANSLKGEEGVRAFTDASESRRQGDDLAVKIDVLQVQVDRLKADAAGSDAQATILNTGIDALKEQGKLLENGWVRTQQSVAEQKKVVTSAVTGGDKIPQSIDSTAQKLNKQLADLSAARSAALEQLNEAEKFAKMAQDEASSYVSTIATKAGLPGKEGEAYKALRAAVNPQMYQYRVGVVQSDKGALSLSQASLYTDVKATVDAARASIESAGMTVPASLAEVNVTPLSQLLDDAKANLKDGALALTNVESGDAPKSLKDAAKSSRLITLFANLNLLDVRQAGGDTAAKAEAAQIMSDAQALKAELAASNVPLPALPGELGEAPAAATPTPAAAPTAPATEPAATPAEPGTTPTEPATPPAVQ